jgi:hypothetical protein
MSKWSRGNLNLAFGLWTVLILCIGSNRCFGQFSRSDKEAWGKVVGLAEALISKGGLLDAKGAEGKLDALVDLHATYCSDIVGKKMSSQRIAAVKQGLRLFFKTVRSRYTGDKRKAILRLLRDLVANRAIFVEILTADNPSDVIEQEMLAYLERNQEVSHRGAVPIKEQITVPKSKTPLQIATDAIRLAYDRGTSGHYNGAIDAGEVIGLNIPLKNVSESPFRSTSGFLQTKDKYVRLGNSEVLYTERSEINGQTVTFAPGKCITPSQHFVFTVLPQCPDGHRIEFTLLAWDSDRGKHAIPFSVTVYNVGPLDFGKTSIDDDIPGRSHGNDNSIMEPGECIEYVLNIQNRGKLDITGVTATLFSHSDLIRFKKNDNMLKYKNIAGKSEQPIAASFVFTISHPDGGLPPDKLGLQLRGLGECRGHQYSWLQARMHAMGVSDDYYAQVIGTAQAAVSSGEFDKAVTVLSSERIRYRLERDRKSAALLSKATNMLLSDQRKKAEEKRLSRLRKSPIHKIIGLRGVTSTGLGLSWFNHDGKSWRGTFRGRDGKKHAWSLRCSVSRTPDPKHFGWYRAIVHWHFSVDGQEKVLTMGERCLLPARQNKSMKVDVGVLRLDVYAYLDRSTGNKCFVSVRIYRLDYGEPN